MTVIATASHMGPLSFALGFESELFPDWLPLSLHGSNWNLKSLPLFRFCTILPSDLMFPSITEYIFSWKEKKDS